MKKTKLIYDRRKTVRYNRKKKSTNNSFFKLYKFAKDKYKELVANNTIELDKKTNFETYITNQERKKNPDFDYSKKDTQRLLHPEKNVHTKFSFEIIKAICLFLINNCKEFTIEQDKTKYIERTDNSIKQLDEIINLYETGAMGCQDGIYLIYKYRILIKYYLESL